MTGIANDLPSLEWCEEQLERVFGLLDVEMRAIVFEDLPPNAIRFQCCLAKDTRPECVSAMEGRRP